MQIPIQPERKEKLCTHFAGEAGWILKPDKVIV